RRKPPCPPPGIVRPPLPLGHAGTVERNVRPDRQSPGRQLLHLPRALLPRRPVGLLQAFRQGQLRGQGRLCRLSLRERTCFRGANADIPLQLIIQPPLLLDRLQRQPLLPPPDDGFYRLISLLGPVKGPLLLDQRL